MTTCLSSVFAVTRRCHRLGEVVLELADDLLEVADLALLREHARALRIARATGDDAVLVDDVAVERDEPIGRRRAACSASARSQVVDDDRAAEQALADRLVAVGEADEVGHPAEHALAADRAASRGDELRAILDLDRAARPSPTRPTPRRHPRRRPALAFERAAASVGDRGRRARPCSSIGTNALRPPPPCLR